ncbi:MAG: hypothetical protein GZ094_08580 [Mariniphaga sp.]|nr:hypothetical protein [Mariniphaga sp.]
MLKLIGCLLFLLPLVAISQEAKKENPVSFYGFVRSDFYLDTYKGLNAFQDVFYLFPNYIGTDANGKDINEQTTANLVSVVTRGGVNINGPEIFGAKTTGCIEVDFAGKPEIFLIRLRKAYTLFTWTKTKLLVGQTWHPFWGNDAFPRIGALNTGTPFQPFNRSPQVRFDYKAGSFTLSATGLYQQQYLSVGPIGSSNTYKRDAVIPETVFSFEYNKKAWTLGAGIDFNRIKPRVSTTGSDAKIYVTDECLNSTSLMGYGKYATGKLMMLLKGYYGQNMAHLTMIGGYGVATYNPQTGKETYTNISSYSTLLNITYGTKWKPGLFLGYLENLGSADPLVNKGTKADIWGCGTNIMNMVRVSPSISYSVPKFLLTAEYERTTAAYGVGGFNFENGLYADNHSVTNNGMRLIMTLFF